LYSFLCAFSLDGFKCLQSRRLCLGVFVHVSGNSLRSFLDCFTLRQGFPAWDLLLLDQGMVVQENGERNYDPERWGLSVSVLTYFYWIFQAYAQRRA
jgi:hypothetical protein